MGITLGAAGALALTRYLDSVLYETRPTEPAAFLGMALLLCVVGVMTSGVPALRAARVDPAEALRAQ